MPVEQPETLSKKLFPHQLTAIEMMEEREAQKNIILDNYIIETKVGIYADITGYGKTLTLVALILRNKMKWNVDEPYIVSNIVDLYGNGDIVKKSRLHFKKIDTTLIVANTSILHQWSIELSGTLSYTILNNRKHVASVEPSLFCVLLCTPRLLSVLLSRFPFLVWKRFIYDDPLYGKNQHGRHIIAGFSWFITANPHHLLYQNHNYNSFIQNIFSNRMDYQVFQHVIVKNNDDFVKQSYSLPELIRHYHKCFEPFLCIVRSTLSEHILKLIHAGEIEQATRLIGGSVGSDIFVLLQHEKKNQIDSLEQKIKKNVQSGHESRLHKLKLQKQELENEIDDLQKRHEHFVMNTSCQICLSPYEKAIVLSCCQTTYCGVCIYKWLRSKPTCPHCRSIVTPCMMMFHVLDESSDSETQYKEKTTKIQMILKLLNDSPHGQFILFSNIDETFPSIRFALEQEDISFVEIYGTMESRRKKIDGFKKGHVKVLFMNNLQNSAGLDLPEASDVIFYHRVSEDSERQIIGRANRIGRTGALHVHYLV
jgi:SNF2 family DNA or RNA helicase